MSAQVTQLSLAGACLVTPKRHGDARGWFQEHWREDTLGRAFVQDNLARTEQAGTLRGLHYQRCPQPQAKLVSVVAGAIRDVIVDIRQGSPTYGCHLAIELTADAPAQLYVPEGFLHGYVTLLPQTVVFYKVTAPYVGALDAAIAWDDPDLKAGWGVSAPLLSEKDRAAPRLRDVEAPFPKGWEATCASS